jgi:TetR/AcrR family transcriptional regulator, cholesterol catabolism regulator
MCARDRVKSTLSKRSVRNGAPRLAAIAQDSESRTRVVSAATALFVRDGFKATSMKAIADQLGISPPALYWHFNSKQELYLAAMEGLLDAFVDYVASQVVADDPRTQLRQFVGGHVTWKLEQRDAAGAYTSSLGMRDIVHELPEDHQSILIERQRRHLNRLRGILTAGAEAGDFNIEDVNVTGFAIVTMCEYVVAWYDPAGTYPPAQIAEKYADLAEAMVTGVAKNSGAASAVGKKPTTHAPAKKAAAKKAPPVKKRSTTSIPGKKGVAGRS